MNQGLTTGSFSVFFVFICKKAARGFAVPDGVRIVSCYILIVKQITQKKNKEIQKEKAPVNGAATPGGLYFFANDSGHDPAGMPPLSLKLAESQAFSERKKPKVKPIFQQITRIPYVLLCL
ncbi:MAG: hypothetical protein IJB00_06860 [Akkermansia sp.]|nr:hypothetical protein [Akkermansia sp.]